MILAHFLRAARLNEAGSETALTAEELQAAHEKLRSLNSAMLRPLLQSSAPWHERLAQISEDSGDWNAAVFHLARLITLNPTEPDLLDRLDQARAKLGNEF